MHAEAFAFVQWAVACYQPHGPVIELGSRDINGSVRGLFAACAPPYIGVDLIAGPGVDVVADAAAFVPAVKVHTVVCCEVLEHTAEAAAIFAQIGQMIATDGIVIVTCATTGRAPHSARDGGPLRPGEFYRNCSGAEVATWAAAAGLCGTHLATTARGDLFYVGFKV
jgi:hypothetical protein